MIKTLNTPNQASTTVQLSMDASHDARILLTPPGIKQPGGSTYLRDVFDNQLLELIDEQLVKTGCFRMDECSREISQKYPYLGKLKEIRIIPEIKKLLDRQITQFVKVEQGGSFSFFIMNVEQTADYPFLLEEERHVTKTTRLLLPRLIPLAMLFHAFAQKYPQIAGIIAFHYADKGRGEGSVLCYDSNFDHHLLIPDSDFLYRHAYQDFKDQLVTDWIPWEMRQSIAYWRGSLTGDKSHDLGWRTMERFHLCQVAADFTDPELIDAKITRITNRFFDPKVIEEIGNSGFMADYAPAIEQLNYKYLLDIDGHSSTWTGLFLRLLTGSTVLKVNSSRGFRQWFHHRLIPFENYVPIKSDLSDLEQTIRYLKNNDNLAKSIGEAGCQLAYAMTLENEINNALPLIAAYMYIDNEIESLL
jgi:hypothetical protein